MYGLTVRLASRKIDKGTDWSIDRSFGRLLRQLLVQYREPSCETERMMQSYSSGLSVFFRVTLAAVMIQLALRFLHIQ